MTLTLHNYPVSTDNHNLYQWAISVDMGWRLPWGCSDGSLQGRSGGLALWYTLWQSVKPQLVPFKPALCLRWTHWLQHHVGLPLGICKTKCDPTLCFDDQNQASCVLQTKVYLACSPRLMNCCWMCFCKQTPRYSLQALSLFVLR